MAHFQAVLFDMDGLLIDSERIGCDVVSQVAAEMGYQITPQQATLTLGVSRDGSRKLYAQHFPGLDYDHLHNMFEQKMHRLALEGRLPLKTGAAQLLSFLKEKGIPMAVASSSSETIIRTYLDKAGVLHYFDIVVSGQTVAHSKPAPDIFLKAARMLQADPRHCLVLEDSYNGVKAGRAANCTVCMIPDVLPFVDELKPYVDHVLPSLADVIPLFAL